MNNREELLLANLHHAVIAARRVRRRLPLPRVTCSRSFDRFMTALAQLDRAGHRDAALVQDLVCEAITAIATAAETFSGPDGAFGTVARLAARSAVADHLYRANAPVSVTDHARRRRVKLSRVSAQDVYPELSGRRPHEGASVAVDAAQVCAGLDGGPLNTDPRAAEGPADTDRARPVEEEHIREGLKTTLYALIAAPGLLTERQRQAMTLYSAGCSLRGIARELGTSTRTTATVSGHIRRATSRLQHSTQILSESELRRLGRFHGT